MDKLKRFLHSGEKVIIIILAILMALVLAISKGFLPLTILLVAIGGYVIGMGVTITATYILLSVLAAPALMEYGMPLLTAHLIVFWFCETGGVTPPVALVAFAASGIAKCDPNRAGFAALRLASPLFILPFLFAYTPLLLTGPLPNIIETVISVIIGIIAYAIQIIIACIIITCTKIQIVADAV